MISTPGGDLLQDSSARSSCEKRRISNLLESGHRWGDRFYRIARRILVAANVTNKFGTLNYYFYFEIKWTIPSLFFVFIFSLLNHNCNVTLPQLNVSKSPSSIRCWDSNPQLLEHKTTQITTGPLFEIKWVFIFLFLVLTNFRSLFR